ncbi:hypothetical protein EWM64_g10160 [Hericium alpestre]|uniref:Uncharacterized protein n=1 Tax=Hericium alpestre TaxID=135208 RepID=A0A4Y9ZGW6_9AGAM|nr:hypothetical protein EWM64_g10160 [Hericium alpestre]
MLSKLPAHLEHSYYGPISTLLSLFYTADLYFLVKPQARIRNPPEDFSNVDFARLSIDTYGNIITTTKHDRVPDFLISFVGDPLDLHSEIPIGVIELKRDKTRQQDAFSDGSQMDVYTEWVHCVQSGHTVWSRQDDLVFLGILIWGTCREIRTMSRGMCNMDITPRHLAKMEVLQKIHAHHDLWAREMAIENGRTYRYED